MGRTMAGRLSALLLVTIFAACSAGSGSEQEAVPMREINYWSMWCDYEPQAAVLKQWEKQPAYTQNVSALTG